MKRFVLGIGAATFLFSALGITGLCALRHGWSPPDWIIALASPGPAGFCEEHGVPERERPV